MRKRPPLALLFAFAVATVAVFLIWLKLPNFTHMGRDAEYALWVSDVSRQWAHPFDVTAIDPFQGMTSMLVAINPYFLPGEWLKWTALPADLQLVLSYVAYFIEVAASAWLLGVAVGFSHWFAFAAAMWLCLLLFPPYNFMFGLQGWLGTAAFYGHTLAICNVALAAFARIGAVTCCKERFWKVAFGNWLLATAILALLLSGLLAAPFYNAGMYIGFLLAAGILFVSSSSREQVAWRIGAALYVAALAYALGIPEFFMSARAYAVRFAGDDSVLLGIRWPVDLSSIRVERALTYFCNQGIACGPLEGFPLAATGSYWLHVAIIVGGVVAGFRLPRPLSRIGLSLAAVWTALLLMWLLVGVGLVRWSRLSEQFFRVDKWSVCRG
jgi:hypothetical protein